MLSINSLLPPASISQIQSWIHQLGVIVELSKPRKTKLGDFKVQGRDMFISINNNLNPYSCLITLTHELAHAFVYIRYKNRIKPHGREWQLTFKSMLLHFMSPDYFPHDILQVLSLYIKKPTASTLTDVSLSTVLKVYDAHQTLSISEITKGEKFKTNKGRIFIKGPQLRKRFKCIEYQTNNVYSFHPLTEITRL